MNQDTGWVCPNDRELMLRAKLETGWSCKSSHFQTLNNKPEKINEKERKAILEVLARAQKTEELEKKRISKMIDRLENIKRSARGNGQSTCILCAEHFGLFTLQAHACQGCHKMVCNKCGVDTVNNIGQTVWFCKICSETKEILKKSGSWFYTSEHPVALNLESNIKFDNYRKLSCNTETPVSHRRY